MTNFSRKLLMVVKTSAHTNQLL